MKHTIFKRAGIFTMLVAMVFVLTPLVAYSGGPEPGPGGEETRYSYDPPPFSGYAELELLESAGTYTMRIVDGTLRQLGNSECSIEVDEAESSTYIPFAPESLNRNQVPDCRNLHPNDLMGFVATVYDNQLSEDCGIDAPIYIEIIATANLQCLPLSSEDDFPAGANATLIVMQYVER